MFDELFEFRPGDWPFGNGPIHLPVMKRDPVELLDEFDADFVYYAPRYKPT